MVVAVEGQPEVRDAVKDVAHVIASELTPVLQLKAAVRRARPVVRRIVPDQHRRHVGFGVQGIVEPRALALADRGVLDGYVEDDEAQRGPRQDVVEAPSGEMRRQELAGV